MSGFRLELAPARPAPEADVEAVLECLRSGWLTMGPRIQSFEQAFAAWVGVPHAVTVSSGTAALHLACKAAGVAPGDEVIVPAFGSPAAVEAARRCGAEPVLCDLVSPRVPAMDVIDVERRITERTRAIVAVHLWGHGADVVLLRELCVRHGLALLEDATAALGASIGTRGENAGTIGDAGCFSMHDGGQLSVGEGGVVVTSRQDVADSVRRLRAHALTSGTWDRHRGHAAGYDVVDIGFNFRLDEPRAALGAARLPRVSEEIDARRSVVRRYRERLADASGIGLLWDREEAVRSAHGSFAVLLADRAARDAAGAALADAGIETGHDSALAPLPKATEAADRLLRLPIAGMTEADADFVADALLAL